MAQLTISQLPQAQPLSGTETVPINQNGLTVQTTVADIANAPTQQQTFITVNGEPTLPNSRQFSGGLGIGISDTGAQGLFQVSLNGASGSLEVSTNGLVAKTSGSTVVGRSIASTGNGITVTNANGVAGNPTLGLEGAVGDLNGLAGAGIVYINNGNAGLLQVVGTPNEIDVANGTGPSNPTIGLADNPVIPGSEGVVIPAGNTADRGIDTNGKLRYNSETSKFEGYQNNSWVNFGTGDGTVTSVAVSGGTTGLTTSGSPITSSGTITLDGTLNAANGGTGQSSYALGDLLYASGVAALSKLGIGTSSYLLASDGSAPVWSDPSGVTVGNATNATYATSSGSAADLSGGLANQVVYQDGAGSTSFIAAPISANTFLKWDGSGFSWSIVAGAGTVTSVDASGGTTGLSFSGGPITSSGTLTLAGTLVTDNGGTGLTSYVAGDTLYYTSGTALSKLSIGSAGYVMTSTGSAPQWTAQSSLSVGSATTATNVAGGSANQIVYNTGAGATSFIVAPTTPNTYLEWSGSAFQWSVNPLGTVTSVGTGTGLTGGPITTSGTINFSNAAVGTWAATPSSANLAAAMTDETGSGSLVFANSPTLSSPTIDGANPYIQFNSGAAVALAAGRMWYDGATGSWNLGMGNGNITQQVGEEFFVYGKASAAITDSPLQIVYKTGTVGGSGVITFAPTVSGITNGDLIIGVATESLALNQFGRVTSSGVVRGITTDGSAYGEVWADGDDIWYNPVTGNPTNVKPVAPNIKVLIGTLIKAGNGGSGSIQVEINHGSVLGGTDSNVQLTSVVNANLLQYDSGLGYWKNVAPGSVTGVGSLANALTIGTGLSGTSYNGSSAVTITNTGVLSLTGTANQVTVSASTGAVTLSLPATINVDTSGNAATATTATNAVNVAVTADATNATRYLGFYSATTGNVGTLVDADITYNPSTNTLTTGTVVATAGISGGTF